MNRRELIIALLASCGWAATHGDAQTAAPSQPRVVFIAYGNETTAQPLVDRFRRGMREHGQKEGGSFRLEVLYADRDPTRVPGLLRDAVAVRPAVLVVTGLLAARDARDVTSTVPVVVTTSSDLVDAGVVKSFARPGGNITGLTDLVDELAVKRLELLKETLPKTSRVALLVNPAFPATPKIERSVQAAARTLGIAISVLNATDPASLVLALNSLEKSKPDALLIGGDALHLQRAQEIIDRTRTLRVPVIHYWPGTAEMGALISHQADIFYNFQRAAYYVDRILKGAKVFDLKIPQSILLRADRVID
ncbi:MAG: ABC transporter substrate-binding protein [Burkholderiales bacterium]